MIKFKIDVELLREKAEERNIPQMYLENPDLLLPKRSTGGSAGYDIIAPYTFDISGAGGGFYLMESFVKIEMSREFVAYMHVRSSTGIKRFIHLMNGTGIIDSDFNKAIIVPLRCFVPQIKERINAGERIAQIIFHKYFLTDDDEHKNNKSEDIKKRDGGIGSTGK